MKITGKHRGGCRFGWKSLAIEPMSRNPARSAQIFAILAHRNSSARWQSTPLIEPVFRP
jgi:hypothetical protein